ncbi:MAG: hypothetical protein K2Y56_02075 [Methylobacterium sp.]|uniref:hypothetical protein n=1 Tax=Methylobacterium sp. TaxID=409 RepID=UPI0025D79710|nr:hypothetical protein [Methylobacterium sp.]MBX9930319.1 hypothetical protein [Methylobacterium sp.]
MTFIIAATSTDDETSEPTIYGVVKRRVQDAMEEVRALAGPSARIELAGSLSKRTARVLELKPNDVRQL